MVLMEFLDIGTILCGLVVFLVLYIIRDNMNKTKLKVPPGPFRLPIIGTLYAHGFTPQEIQRLHNKYGDIISMQLGSKPFISISDLNIIQKASKIKELSDRGIVHDIVGSTCNPNTKGIIACDFDTAQTTRSMSLAIFRELGVGRSVMENKILEVIDNLMTSFKNQNQSAFDPTSMLEVAATKLIVFVTLSKNSMDNDPELHKLIKGVNAFMAPGFETFIMKQFPCSIHFPPFKGTFTNLVNGTQMVNDYIKRCIAERTQNTNGERTDFVDCYNSKDYPISEHLAPFYDNEQLVYLLRDLLIAGSDTSVTSLSWVLVCLANRPNIQETLNNQIQHVVGKNDKVRMSDKVRLPYVEAFIAELQRYYSIAPGSLQHFAKEDVSLCGYHIPKTAFVYFNILAIHKDDRLWMDPLSFKPERFLDEEGKFKKSPNFIPFSMGKRSCLGEVLARQELFLFTANLVKCFRILPPEGTDLIDETGKWNLLFRPTDLKIRLIPY